ncbi:hypothetical protein ABPG75_009205 [Micractinium tetrahymenae]
MAPRSPLKPAATSLVLALACAVLALLPGASAHGFVAEPAARNVVRNWQYCPHCVNAGGPWPVSKEGKLTWPAYSMPVCGDRELERAGSPVAHYTAGGEIDITVFITAFHGGRHQFRLCPSDDVTESCLDQNVLERADGSGPYSWTPVDGGSAPGAKWRKDNQAGQGGESYTWRYRLPKGVSCERCVLQWFWTTANSCKVPGAPSWVGSDPGMLFCNQPGPYPEVFANCADISIGGGGGSGDSSPDKDSERRSERAASQSTGAEVAAQEASQRRQREKDHAAPATSNSGSRRRGSSSRRRTGSGRKHGAGGSRRRSGRATGRRSGRRGGRRSSTGSRKGHRRHAQRTAGSNRRRTGRSRRAARGF